MTADSFRLKQILLNLLSNAIKFTPAGGSVMVAAGMTPQGDVAISVEDTGIGMEPEDIPRALEPFGQLAGSQTRSHQGTGLGLPITRRLVELHQGHLAITSASGQGTTVTIILPMWAAIAYQIA